MLIGLGLPVSGVWATPASLASVGKLAEERGYHGLWAFQRLLVGADQEMAAVYQSVLDPVVALSYTAACTSRYPSVWQRVHNSTFAARSAAGKAATRASKSARSVLQTSRLGPVVRYCGTPPP